jgi:M6 family metalloprotease-like protein
MIVAFAILVCLISDLCEAMELTSLQRADRIARLNQEIRTTCDGVRPADKTNLRPLLVERKQAMEALSIRAPESIAPLILEGAILSGLPNDLRDLAEHEQTLTGRIECRVVDDFDHGKSMVQLYLMRGDTTILLITDQNKTKSLYGLRNKTVSIAGVGFGSFVVITSVASVDKAALTPLKQGPFNVLFLLATYPSSPPVPFSVEQFREWILQDTSAVRRFFREMSYGKAEMTGDAYGWFTLPDSTIDSLGQVMTDLYALNKVVTNAGIDLARFDNVVWIQNITVGKYFGSGLGEMGRGMRLVGERYYYFGQTWIRDLSRHWTNGSHALTLPTSLDHTICHELGHNMELFHADVWDGSPSDDWSVPDKRQNALNPFDVMSYVSYIGNAFHFNAIYKDALGWLDSSSIVHVRRSGDYFLRPYESNRGIRAAEIRSSDTSRVSLMVEYRQPLGFDANINPEGADGPMVNTSWGFIGYRVEEHPSWAMESILLQDKTGASRYTIKTPWTITRAGVTVGPVLSVSDTGMVFRVTLQGQVDALEDRRVGIPGKLELEQNFPNPFNPSTTIRFALPQRAVASLSVFNALGQRLATLLDGELNAGSQEVRFDATGYATGVYYYRLQSGGQNVTRPLLIVR